ncbi:MAG: lipid A export permease/ATP-binding protein MsbA [Burkholderiaceae bacterium]|nr:lipid A export permease/ATP-binding protein MsbA [Burkholderiaceae bacterium]
MKFPPNLKRLFQLLAPFQGRIYLALIGMAVTASTEPTLVWMLKELLDRGFAKPPTIPFWAVPVCVIGLFVVRGVSTFATTYLMTWVSTRLLNEMRRKMFDRLLDVPLGFYASTSVGQVINSMMFEVQQVIDMIKNVIVNSIRSSLTAIGLIGYLFYLNWQLTLVTVVLIPTITAIIRVTGKRLSVLTQRYLAINAEMTQVLEETTRAHQVIKLFGGQDYERTRFEQRADKLRSYSMKMSATFAATVPITQTLTSVAVSVVIVIALVQAMHGHQTTGEFVAFITNMLMILTPLKQLAEINGPLQRGLSASDAVFNMIDAPSERTDGKVLAQRATGRIDFVDVGFTYPGAEKPALSHIDLTVMPGETVAFVGMSGGGKSTLVNLVPEFQAASSGEIRLDGEPIRQLALHSLRAQMAMVSQHVVLFDDTVAANIAYGDTHPDPARVAAAVKAAHLTEVVAGLQQGLDTLIGDNGNRLSGGQRQRLAIARAIYKDAPILILDEATSALDTESERAVQGALDDLMRDRTTLVIAHRLSTIERASRIVVLVHGEIVEIGTHAELLAKNGAYANLYHLQFEKEAA